MLTAEGCANRRERLRNAFGDRDAFIIADPSSLVYFAGFAPSPFVFRTVESGAILILQGNRATLVGDNLLAPFLSAAFVDERVAPVWYEGKRSAPGRRALLIETAREVLQGVAPRRIGIESAAVPFGLLDGLLDTGRTVDAVSIDSEIRSMRRVKDADELADLRRSMRAGEAGQAAALREIEPGMTELDAYLIVQAAASRETGGQPTVYGDFIVDAREGKLGGPPSSRKIERGDLLLLDFSVVIDGYRGDFTNTFVIGSKPTARQLELFATCMEALDAGESLLAPGVEARRIDAAVRSVFGKAGVSKYSPSHVGHGLGLGHPEPPYIVPESDDVLEVGNVVAIEPGVYLPGGPGMRFERNYLIVEGGYETLSRHRLAIDASS